MTGQPKSFRDLTAWQRSMAVAKAVYDLTRDWPAEERFGLTGQIRRAAVSVPSNIAEGQGRTGGRQLAQALSVAHGSLCEVETQLLLAQEFGYVTSDSVAPLHQSISETGRIIRGLIQSLGGYGAVREEETRYDID